MRVCPLWELSTGSCTEQMLCTLDRASAAGREAWKHLKQPVLGLLVGNAVGEITSQESQCQKLYVPSKSHFYQQIDHLFTQ